jgi:NADH:ubiquinone oxidoreductase subunit C
LLDFICIERFVLRFFFDVIIKFLQGFMLKLDNFFFFFSFWSLHILVFFFFFSRLFCLGSLLDIIVSDFPSKAFYRFEFIYSFWSLKLFSRFFLKTFASIILPIMSLSFFFSSASWLEREIWDMFGLKFFFNFDLRRVLSDYGFFGHPLRKDFPVVGFVEARYNNVFQSVLLEPVELLQQLREFLFKNTWVTV